MNSPFFSQLRSSTETLHKALEQTPISMAIMAPEVSKDTYAEYLYKSYGMHQEIETLVFPLVNTIISDIETRKKTDHIVKDLQQLGLGKPSSETIQNNDGYRNNLHFHLGMLYVTEGSTLGGLHILKNIHKAMGPETPGNFLQVYGDKTGSMWKGFLSLLDQHIQHTSETENNEIIAGALYEFQRGKTHFEKAL